MNKPETQVEAALVILVPEADPLIYSFRTKYDPATIIDIPAHITINYPFKPGIEPEGDLIRNLTDIFSRINAFDFSLPRLGSFPGVLYLAPDPDVPFKVLIEKIAGKFPDSPIYGGIFDAVVPHLTLVHCDDHEISRVEQEFMTHFSDILPLSSAAKQVSLMDNKTGHWKIIRNFKLGTG